MRKNLAKQQCEVSVTKPRAAQAIETGRASHCQEPAVDFLTQLQERFAISEEAAAEKLGCWLLTYEPGPLALARAGARAEPRESKQSIAA